MEEEVKRARGAPLGNKNNVKYKVWTLAINKALEKRSNGDRMIELEKLAGALIDKCYEGDMVALKELGDRLEGKPAQSVTVSGDEDSPLQIAGRIILVRPSAAE